MYRAVGAYSYTDYQEFFKKQRRGGVLQLVISILPPGVANSMIALYWYYANRKARAGIYDLVRSANASGLTKLIARRLNIVTR
jgi:hypothetical protein